MFRLVANLEIPMAIYKVTGKKCDKFNCFQKMQVIFAWELYLAGQFSFSFRKK